MPCVRGKWPGNLDIAIRLVRSIDDDYLSTKAMADLFDEYGSNTVNTRILWADQVRLARSICALLYLIF